MKSIPLVMISVNQMNTDLTKILGFLGMIIVRHSIILSVSQLILIPKNLFNKKFRKERR